MEERDYAKWLRYLVAMLFLLIVVFTLAQVGFRFILNRPLIWSEELVRFLLIWMVMIGAAVISFDNKHLSVDGFVDILPIAVQFVLYTLRQMAVIGFCGVLIATSIRMIHISHMDASGALEIPLSYWRSAPSVGACLIIPFTMIRYFRDLKLFRQGKYGKGKEATSE